MLIFIHGQGAISAAGPTAAAAWRSYLSGQRCWSADAATGLPVYRIGALPEHPEVAAFAARHEPDRATLLALHAADAAVKQAGWQGKDFAILVGCSRGPTESWEAGYAHFAATGAAEVRTSPNTTLGSIGFALAAYFGVETPATSLSVTCSSGMHALLHGIALLRAGMADRVLVGGAEAPLTAFTLRQMAALRITASVPEEKTYACRPFADPVSGMTVGEGAAFLALSRSDEPAIGRITGVAWGREQQDSQTGISPNGDGLQKSMKNAIRQSGIPDTLIAHAPGTKRGDAAELAAIREVFTGRAMPQLTSLKWATGHTFGASGPLALSAGLEMLRTGSVPALPYPTPLDSANRPVQKVLVNATGFGGNVVSVVVEG